MELNTSKSEKQAFNGATKAVDQVANKVQAGAERMADSAKDFESNLTSRYEAFKTGAVEGYDTAVQTVKKYPLYTVLGSAAIGLLAGVIISRRKD